MLAVQIIAGTNDQVNIQIWLEMKQDLDLCLEIIERDRGKKPLNNVPRLSCRLGEVSRNENKTCRPRKAPQPAIKRPSQQAIDALATAWIAIDYARDQIRDYCGLETLHISH